MVWQIVLLTLGVAAGVAWLLDRKTTHKLRNKELDITARKVEVESKRVDAETLAAEAAKTNAEAEKIKAETAQRAEERRPSPKWAKEPDGS